MDQETDYYKISLQIYACNYLVGQTKCLNALDFIEKNQSQSSDKGVRFYKNILASMARIGELHPYRMKLFLEVHGYCKQKIQEITTLATAPAPIAETKAPELKTISVKTKETQQPTNLTHVLQLYYEKGCRILNKNMIAAFAIENNLNKSALCKKLASLNERNLNGGNYIAQDNTNSIDAFKASYEFLLNKFESFNSKAFQSVGNDYKQLKENNPVRFT